MDPSASGSATLGMSALTIGFVILGLVVIFYMYTYIYKNAQFSGSVLVPNKISGRTPPTLPNSYMLPTEGGEYTVNAWVYINSFNSNMNTPKHIFEIKGAKFSTLLIALGAFKNTLMVRTHTADPGQSTSGGSGGSVSAFTDFTELTGPTNETPDNSVPTSTTPPNVEGFANNDRLTPSVLTDLFKPKAANDSLMITPPPCDLPEIDLQRWTLVTVVLSGRTTDVYLDGKLARSCGNSSYFKVDPAGTSVKLLQNGGFDGHLGQTSVANYGMNPDEIYKTYLSGPEGSPLDIIKWIEALFVGGKMN